MRLADPRVFVIQLLSEESLCSRITEEKNTLKQLSDFKGATCCAGSTDCFGFFIFISSLKVCHISLKAAAAPLVALAWARQGLWVRATRINQGQDPWQGPVLPFSSSLNALCLTLYQETNQSGMPCKSQNHSGTMSTFQGHYMKLNHYFNIKGEGNP